MEYYKAYEKRYQAVYDADIELWGNSEKDVILAETIKKWVEDNGLKGKRVIEFACGEGSLRHSSLRAWSELFYIPLLPARARSKKGCSYPALISCAGQGRLS